MRGVKKATEQCSAPCWGGGVLPFPVGFGVGDRWQPPLDRGAREVKAQMGWGPGYRKAG